MRPHGSDFLYWMVFVSSYRDGVLVAKLYANLFIATFLFGPIAAIAEIAGGSSPQSSVVIGLVIGYMIATASTWFRHKDILAFYDGKQLDVTFRGRMLWTIYLIVMFVLLAGVSAKLLGLALLILLIFLLVPSHKLVRKRDGLGSGK